jgi:hypothetical protein
VSALCFHFAFIVWAPLVFALVGLIRGRGAWLANVAALLATLGATTLPGFLLVDNYDIAIVQELGGDAWQRVTDNLEDQPGATVLFITGVFGFVTSLPIALFAAWRARLLPLWTPIAVAVGAVAAQAFRPYGLGLLLLAAVMMSLSYALWKLDWRGELAPAATLSP